MPLLDHFRPPIKSRLPWRSMHTAWIGELTVRLNAILPPGYVALETVQFGGRLELDIGTYEETSPPTNPVSANGTGVAVAPAVWTPPAAVTSFPAELPDIFEIKVFDSDAAGNLVGAIEMVSPSNKDRPTERQQFAAKCASYIGSGASVIIVDAVTTRRANLHNEIIHLMGAPADSLFTSETTQYSVAYRPVKRGEAVMVDVWTAAFSLGELMPTMPLRLTGDLFIPVDFETAYTEACRKRRLIA